MARRLDRSLPPGECRQIQHDKPCRKPTEFRAGGHLDICPECQSRRENQRFQRRVRWAAMQPNLVPIEPQP